MENKPIRSSDLAALMNDVFHPTQRPPQPASDVNDDDELTVSGDAPPEVRQLRECQRLALSAIMTGKGYGHAAAAAGVDRKTVYNWAKKDPVFQAALSAWRQRMEQHVKDELTSAVAAAARTFGHAAATDWRAAAVLLRQRGLLAGEVQRAPDAGRAAGALQSELDAMLPARRRDIETRIRELIASLPGKEPEYMPELRALQERMVAEEAAAVPTVVQTSEKSPA